MANKVLLKKSSVASKVPLAADLDYGELALNYQDGKIYYKKADNSIDSFSSTVGSVSGVASVAGYTGAVTATQLITAINTVDGSGSGLDADLLDGLNSATTNTVSTIVARDGSGNFAAGTITATLTGSATSVASQGTVTALATTADAPAGITMQQAYSNGYPTTYGNVISLGGAGHNQIFFGWSGTSGASADNYIRSQRDTSDANWSAWAKIWTDINDGTGSGLDADLLDGNDSAYFINTSATAQTKTGDLTITGNLTVNGTTTTINSTVLTVDDINIELGSITSPTDTTANGGGITLKGTTDKTFNWVQSTGYWTASNSLSAPQHISTIAQGTAPLIVTSTTLVTNLNSQYLNGYTTGTTGNVIPLLNTANTWGNNQNINLSSGGAAVAISNTGTGTALSVDKAIVSTLATGTAPFTIASTTLVSNLNSQYLNGQLATYYIDTSSTAQTKAGNLTLTGALSATTKSFLIEHPTKPNMKLRYGSLEGPENGVYVRGRLKGNKIELPDYWTKLVDPESITVNLTAIGKHQDLYVKSIENNTITVANSNLVAKSIDCFYVVYGERCDVAKLDVETAK